ncbi:MAG: hypothetical protein ACOZNI_24255 [Myxococcota bacterium]
MDVRPQPSTAEPMLVITVGVVLAVFVACVEMDVFQPWLARLVDEAAIALGVF